MTGDPQIKALIVDDERLARQLLREMLEEFVEIEVVGECANGFEAVKAVSEHQPDLIFLDIQMPKLNGFEVLELLEDPPAVVFVTAYDKYALDAFDAHAVDYLLKPFATSRLEKAIEKVRRNLSHGLPPIGELREAAGERPVLNRVVVKDGTSVVIIGHEQIDYVQAEDDYISIHAGGQSHLKHQTISSLEGDLDPNRFVRIHRSTILNVERIDRIEPYTRDRYLAVLADGTELNISRSGHKRLKELLG